MSWQVNVYAFPTMIGALAAFVLAVAGWQRRRAPGGIWLALMMGTVAWYMATYTLEQCTATLPGIFLWVRLEYLAILLVVPFWLLFILRFSGFNPLKRHTWPLLFILPALSLLMVWTNDWHHLFYQQIALIQNGNVVLFNPTYGPWFWLQSAYNLLLFALGIGLCLSRLRRRPAIYRQQARWMVLGTSIPLVSYILTMVQLIPSLDPFPFGLLGTGLVTFFALRRQYLADLTPIARAVVLEEMEEAVLVLDAEDHLVDCNAAGRRLMGIDPKQSLGQPLEVLLGRWPAVVDRFRGSASASAEIALEDGRALDVQISPLRKQGGQALGRLLLARDLSSQKQEREAQRDEYERLSRILDAMQELIYVCDIDNQKILFTNRALQEAFGGKWAQGRGDPGDSRSNPLSQDDCDDLLHTLLVKNSEAEIHSPVNGRDYHRVECLIRWPGGRDVRLGIASDITERKRAELLQADMLRAVVHDLSNPIAAIQAALELAPEAGSALRSEEYRQLMMRNVSRLSILVRNLLDVARIDAGDLRLEKANLDLNEMLKNLAEAEKPLLLEKKLSCRLSLHDRPLRLQGDPAYLEEVFANLLGNAIKFTPAGGSITIHLTQQGSYAQVVIADSGPGIQPQDLPHIFDRFYRGHGRGSGTGLGLFIAHWVVQHYGGTIQVASEIGQGTSFTVRLPLDSEPALT